VTGGAAASPRGSFERTVAALVESVVRARVPGGPARTREVTDVVLAQHRRMPAHLRAGVRAATLTFGWAAVPHGGRPFHAASAPARDARLARWRGARLGPCRNLVRFWESLVVHAWFAAAERDGR
jgi:hypothetical protein